MTQVTIVIPTVPVDRGYLTQAVVSVLQQTIPVKLIVERSQYSCAVNLANGVAKVDTPYYSILGDDDYLVPHYAEKLLSAIGDADVCICDAIQFSDSITTIYRAQYTGLTDLLARNTIHGGAVLYRTAAAQGKYNANLYCAEEYDLHLRLASEGAKFTKLDAALYMYRKHENQKSRQSGENMDNRKCQIEIIKKRYQCKEVTKG